ncbi:DUF305 domain-containing protein [Brevundimonas sp.]|uniref:DUF305 domain-containing protein n=1 Tax=Brevundimonas sp. TaxID=1871086 RepID=UPI002737C0D9|nr:DUF305 domain-containing protein [Brevundimonas sp.]MDP3803820.1 DUF305 domain-containing protein [Brevundimonas sp.]
MHSLAGLMLAGWMATQAGAPSPPIFQPGAPGAGSRTITAAEAVALSRSTFTADDVAFMQHMIVHHGQAVEMVALLEAQGADPAVKRLGRRIAMSQEAEMDLMRGWLAGRGQPLDMPGMAHAGHAGAASDTPLMPGMLSPARMQALAAARGPAFDRLFLEGMIRHHQGAIDMVETLMTRPDAAQDTLLSDFANAVVADQSAEILRMQSLLSDF